MVILTSMGELSWNWGSSYAKLAIGAQVWGPSKMVSSVALTEMACGWFQSFASKLMIEGE